MGVEFLRVEGEEAFEAAAVALLRRQVEKVRVFGDFVRAVRGGGGWPERLEDWPALPVEAFRRGEVWGGDPGGARGYFETSGTTGGERGRHWFTSLESYRASVVAGWLRFMPEVQGHEWVSLIPSVELRPHSSLARMVAILAEEVGGGRKVPIFVDGDFGLEVKGFGAWLREREGREVMLFATTFAIAAWCEAWRDAGGGPIRLGPGSVLFETGGFKGRGRELEPGAFLELVEGVLGLGPSQIWNEYGMTELFSQGYRRRDQALHRVPPWVRVRIRDPETGELCAEGERGLIEVIDLANQESVAAVGTRDVGVWRGEGFEVLGRVAGAEARGCSLPYGLIG
ncbi:MAG: hypothetical protein SNJ84_04265 [Verrucomicrobiia bacterium]